MAGKLQNYLRTHRKSAGLSQEDMALLLGCRGGTKISRWERCVYQPSLETALAYEAVLGAPVRELFAGLYERQIGLIQERAQMLAQVLEEKKSYRNVARKLDHLGAFCSASQANPSAHD